MALSFSGVNSWLKYTGPIATAMPLSMFCYAKSNGDATARTAVGTGRVNGGDPVYCSIGKNASSNYPIASHRTPGSSRSSTGAAVISSSAYMPICGIFLSTGTQVRYGAAGALSTLEATARTDVLSAHEHFFVGAGADLATPTAGMWIGDIGEVALWSSDLSNADHVLLEGGALPETVSPGTLIDVWDLETFQVSGNYVGRVNGKVLASSGSGVSQAATHPITRTVAGTTINCTPGNAAATGAQATIQGTVTIAATVGAASATGATATVTNSIPGSTVACTVGNAAASGATAAVGTFVQSDRLINNTGTLLPATAVYWTWTPAGRIGSMVGITPVDGTGTTDANARLAPGIARAAGKLDISVRAAAAVDDAIYTEMFA
jgi:hypothetical protein